MIGTHKEFKIALDLAKTDEERDQILQPLLDAFKRDTHNADYQEIYSKLQMQGYMNYGDNKGKGYFLGWRAFSNQPQALEEYKKSIACGCYRGICCDCERYRN